jgi:hypothetical protein
MKRKHRIPVDKLRLSDPVTPEYQSEIDATMERAAARYAQAQRALERAQARVARIRATAVEQRRTAAHRRELRIAEADLELRREELRRLDSLMHASPQSASHRGKRSYRPRPDPKLF